MLSCTCGSQLSSRSVSLQYKELKRYITIIKTVVELISICKHKYFLRCVLGRLGGGGGGDPVKTRKSPVKCPAKKNI